MKRLLLFLAIGFCVLTTNSLFAQTTLLFDDFEGNTSWNSASSNNPNRFIIGNCVNNGGSKACYVSISNGTTNDCSPTGIFSYQYQNAPTGNVSTLFFTPVNSACFSNLVCSYDLKIDGQVNQDFFELVYSTNGGTNWTVLGTPLSGITNFATQTQALPATLNGVSFLIGFRFTYNNSVIIGNPPAIDNFKIEGISSDVTLPTCTNPTGASLIANANCEVIVPNVVSIISASDNCTATNFLSITQIPAAGTIQTSGFGVDIIIEDQSGNIVHCGTNFTLIDTLDPVLTCPNDTIVYPNASCDFTLQDYLPTATGIDNCSTLMNWTQIPANGTVVSNENILITISAQDISGNQGLCTFHVNVLDTVDPVITCPATINLPSNFSCDGIVPDMGTLVSALDNCSASNFIFFTQNLVEGSVFSNPTNIIVFAQDQSLNQSQCSVQLTSSDLTGPVINCQDTFQINISDPCDYLIPDLAGTHVAFDNCSLSNTLTFSQSPLPGVSSSNYSSVTITYEDPLGNSSQCITVVKPNDLTPPVITCPASITTTNVNICTAPVPDFIVGTITSDNCTSYTLSQTPAVGTIVTSGTNTIIITSTDGNGNSVSCSTQFILLETIAPSILCPPNISTCSPQVNYAAIQALDNCLYKIIQTDNSGFTDNDFFPIGVTNQSYSVIDSSGNTASCAFTITVLEFPDTANVLNPNQNVCSQTTGLIEAQAITSGTGTWSVFSGTGVISDVTSLTPSLTNLSTGTNAFIWSVTSPTCGTKRDTAYIMVDVPAAIALLQDSITLCISNGGIIQGNNPTNGYGVWTSPTGVQFTDPSAPITGLNGLFEGFQSVIWTIGNLGCGFTSDTSIVYFPVQAEIYTPDTTICEENLPFIIQASLPDNAQSSYWTFISGTGEFNTPYSPNPEITSASIGEIQIRLRLLNNFCAGTYDTLRITINNCTTDDFVLNTLFTPNNDGKNDLFEIENLNILYPDAKVLIVNRWGNVVFESTGYASPWDGKYKGEDVPMGTYFYNISSPNDAFERVKGPISIIR